MTSFAKEKQERLKAKLAEIIAAEIENCTPVSKSIQEITKEYKDNAITSALFEAHAKEENKRLVHVFSKAIFEALNEEAEPVKSVDAVFIFYGSP